MNLTNNELFTQIDKLFVDGALNGAMTIIGTLIVVRVLNTLIKRAITKSKFEKKDIAIKIIRIMLRVAAIVVVMMQFTFTQTITGALLASGGVVAVTVGLASQEAASGVVSGFMLTVSRPFSIGDYISLPSQGVEGYIVQMNIRHCVVETFDKTEIVVPNTMLNQSIIENVSANEKYRVNRIVFGISYESNIDRAIEIIKEEARNHPLYLDVRTDKNSDEIPVACMELADSSVNLRATVTTKDMLDGYKVKSDLNIAILKRFKAENIEIPYPHIQVIN